MAAQDARVPADLLPLPGDLLADSTILPADSPVLPQDTADLPTEPPDLAGPEVEDAGAPDLGPDLTDEDAERDLVPPADARDAGGQSNGSSCSSPDQCRSGFCVGVPGRCCVQSCASVCYRANQCSTTGACVAAAGAVTCGDSDAVCGLSVKDYANANEWSWQLNLQVGNLATGSDEHTISAVPSELRGSPWIRPSRGSKTSLVNPLVTFTLSAAADVYVGIDTRFAAPSWLSTWTDSGMTLSYVVYSSYEPTSTVTQRLYHARFPPGGVSLGPLACTNTSSCSMYLTIVRFADQPSGTAPACK